MARFFRRMKLIFLLLLMLATVGFFGLRSAYRDVIRDLAETQVKNTTSDLTNDAIAKQIADGVVQYDRIVYFEKDLDGRITALKTNIGEVNRLKTDILNIINDEILALDHSDMGIPLGSLFLPELLSIAWKRSPSFSCFPSAYPCACFCQSCGGHQFIHLERQKSDGQRAAHAHGLWRGHCPHRQHGADHNGG